ncbi:putative bacteriophage protein [Pseudomonas sp. StFLB209]|uniref:baseplate J/gp47 family protein n=1 Tax=Pseudomonas sp. StFLB209 TaxID=1028989 RepID=UPI0004F5A53A|nr:baseplate J/gp47 family protein [Pseudomonas sp. StFLB209]BAP43935.1 putative bacteriophage protein [Pseudomonas sp. StFLB209]
MAVDFKQALADSGIPTTEAGLRAAWEAEVIAQGSQLSNTSAYSPFWRVISALVTKPLLWLLTFVSDTVLPNFFVKTAGGAWLDMLAWAVDVERKGAGRAVGQILFTRADSTGTLQVPIGTVIQSASINGTVYQLVTTALGVFQAGQSQLQIPAIAAQAGAGYNLAPGYYAVLPTPIAGIVAVTNAADWLTTPGLDDELDDELRLRVRNQFSAVNQWHTDSVYRAILSNFKGVSVNGVYFQHGAPRGPGTANAFVLFDQGVPAASYIEQMNAQVTIEGNHGHGDDLLVQVMPETQHDISLQIWPRLTLNADERQALLASVEQFVRTAFRETAGTGYVLTLTLPQSRFSFSRLGEELHQQFPGLESLRFENTDIVSQLNIPRIRNLQVAIGD